MTNDFLPLNRRDMEKRGWESCDFILISADAYVDHPSFGTAIISRVLESRGFRVGIIPQPDWKDPEAFRVLGRPDLAFLISSGVIDSMVNHYTVNHKLRRQDAYSPGGNIGFRPDRPSIVYTSMVKQAFKGVPVILGGLEASLRRLSHYDYWSDKVRHSMLLDSKADLLMYGMGENIMIEIAESLREGRTISELKNIRGTVCAVSSREKLPKNCLILPSYEQVSSEKKIYAESFHQQYKNTDPISGLPLAEPCGKRFVLQNPPALPLNRKELDKVYALPFMRKAHPCYDSMGGIPALKEVEFSLEHNRGCFGSCNFCAITFHQGRIVTSRSHDSVVAEAEKLISLPDFKGYIHDVGGPTANFRNPACSNQLKRGACRDRSCLTPEPCKHLEVDHQDYLDLLRRLRTLKGIKKVFVRSGIRFDYLLLEKNERFLRELCEHHISGQLKVAPEHVSSRVLKAMNKQKHPVYKKFMQRYAAINRELGKKQYLVPYFISSHPGSTLKDAIQLAEFMKETHFIPEQVQDYYPTPGTISTCMYYTGLDPETMKPIEVVRKEKDKRMQRALLQFNRPENYHLVREALEKEGRTDLIGSGPRCLIGRPSSSGKAGRTAYSGHRGKAGQSGKAARPGKYKGKRS